MDEKIEISTFIADNSKADSSNSDSGDKELKEKSELIYEIKTICNLDTIVPNCELLKNNSLAFSEQNYFKQPVKDFVKNSFSMDNNAINMCYLSKPNVNEKNFVGCFPQSQMIFPDNNQEKNDFSQNQMSKITNFKHCKNNFDESNYHGTNTVFENNTVLKQEIKELPLQQMTDMTNCKENDSSYFTHSQEKRFAHQEYQQSADSCDGNLLDDTKRTSRRNSKRKKDFDGCCPICGVTVRINDLESHYNQEVERLSKISRCSKRVHTEEVPKNETFDLVQKNRENRLTARVARYSARAKSEVKCPVCSLRMSGTAEEINKHVAICIQDEDSDVNVDGDEDDGTESFEEYEIGDETRIRPISLVPGGYRSLHGNSVRQTAEDEDLNVDVDDTIAYGDPQYSEIDVIPNTSSEKDRLDLEQLRKAVAVDSSSRPQNLESHKWSKIGTDTESSGLSNSVTDSDPVISSLKEKIKALEDQDKSVRCLICLESYTKPVVSTTCWHVHCEECWLMTMGVKKLCPQCNMIVFPSDLRKIYL